MPENPPETDAPDLIPRCPRCGEPARGTLEIVQGVALVYAKPETGTPAYTGETEIFWDTQKTIRHEGVPTWVCSCGHDWPVDIVPDDR